MAQDVTMLPRFLLKSSTKFGKIGAMTERKAKTIHHTKSGRLKGNTKVKISGAGVISVSSSDIVTSTEGKAQIRKLKLARESLIRKKGGPRRK